LDKLDTSLPFSLYLDFVLSDLYYYYYPVTDDVFGYDFLAMEWSLHTQRAGTAVE